MAFPILAAATLGSSVLGGLLSRGGQKGPSLRELEALLSSQNFGSDFNSFFDQIKRSKFGQQSLLEASLRGQNFGSELKRIGGVNLGGSVIGDIAKAASSTTTGFARGQAESGFSSMAMDAAMKKRLALLQAFLQSRGMDSGESSLGNLFGSVSAGLGQFGSLTGAGTSTK